MVFSGRSIAPCFSRLSALGRQRRGVSPLHMRRAALEFARRMARRQQQVVDRPSNQRKELPALAGQQARKPDLDWHAVPTVPICRIRGSIKKRLEGLGAGFHKVAHNTGNTRSTAKRKKMRLCQRLRYPRCYLTRCGTSIVHQPQSLFPLLTSEAAYSARSHFMMSAMEGGEWWGWIMS
jgi:hypothetical protein